MVRRLRAEERVLWDKVIASVRPLEARAGTDEAAGVAEEVPPTRPALVRPVARTAAPAAPQMPMRVQRGGTLDGSWDRRLSRGLVTPDRMVDLHGHNLATAYALLDDRLDEAVGAGARVMLLVTGKPPSGNARPAGRGAIRAAVGDWLGASRHAGAIAAVRGAHPRHGGAGALYIIFRRPRGGA